jgi:cell wall-associated NlpC family hydrolase
MRSVYRVFVGLLASVLAVGLVVSSTSAPAEALTKNQSGKVIKKAASLKGKPYKWGGTTPKGFDCSGYVQYVFKKSINKKLPRIAGDQAKKGKAVNKNKKKRGDLVFFTRGSYVYHVGIYAGKNTIWHASRPGKPVKKEKIWTSAYKVRRL